MVVAVPDDVPVPRVLPSPIFGRIVFGASTVVLGSWCSSGGEVFERFAAALFTNNSRPPSNPFLGFSGDSPFGIGESRPPSYARFY